MQDVENKIYQWMKSNARSLERAFYEYLFHQKSKENVISELLKFQTESGGFASGLEPDSLNPNPSPIQSWAALFYIENLKLNSDHPIIQKLLNYFESHRDEDGFFAALIPSNNDYPHAIWWHYSQENKIWGYNPSVAIWSFIYIHRQSERIKNSMIKALEDFIASPSQEMHELSCFVEAYERLYLLKEEFLRFEEFERVLRNTIDQLLEKSKSEEGYKATPMTFCHHPESQMSQYLEASLKSQVKEIVTDIKEKEIWDIHFHWQQYEVEFQQAKIHWQGIQAIKNMMFIIKYRPS